MAISTGVPEDRRRVVLDANVIIEGFQNESRASVRILDAVANGEVVLVISGYIIKEVCDVMIRSGYAGVIPLFYSFLGEGNIETVGGISDEDWKDNLDLVPGDPKDVPIALAAIRHNVGTIVSRDIHLSAGDTRTQKLNRLVNVLSPEHYVLYLD